MVRQRCARGFISRRGRFAMTIKFFCSCGKHLRAREAMAGRRSVCPACRQPVGIPSLEPTQRGTMRAPLTPAERAGLGRLDPTAAAGLTSTPINDIGGVDVPPKERLRRRSRRVLALEKHWYECLRYPGYAWPIVAALALALTGLTGVAALALTDFDELHPPPWWLWTVVWVAPFLTFGYVGAFLQCVLASGAAGEIGFIRWPGFDLRPILWAVAAWTICFLAGPIVFVAAAFWFWLYTGDPTLVDWLIIAELSIVGVSHWLLALVAVHQGDRLRDANPMRVADVIRRLGYGVVLATLTAVTIGLIFGLVILAALELLHQEPLQGLPLLFAGCFGGLAWLTFFFRLLGLWSFQSRVESWNPAAEVTVSPASSIR
jgi:hypothetical protein